MEQVCHFLFPHKNRSLYREVILLYGTMTTVDDGTSLCCNEIEEERCAIQPFEWLTNFTSLIPFLSQSFLFKDEEEEDKKSNRSALHVGCGSSSLGEGLVQFLGYNYVLNIDRDKETLDKMKQRWNWKYEGNGQDCPDKKNACNDNRMKMDWQCIDFFFTEGDETDTNDNNNNNNNNNRKNGNFDLIIDKSTLDCALCSDEGATGLLCYVYKRLHPIHGVYVLVSFHPVELIQPLLQKCPGTNWTVEHYAIDRQMDAKDEMPQNLTTTTTTTVGGENIPTSSNVEMKHTDVNNDVEYSNEEFLNDAVNPQSSSTVNIFVCRRHDGQNDSKNSSSNSVELSRIDVRDHVHKTNDEWFQTHHPLLTRVREKELCQAFENSNHILSLDKCYQVLFTDAEREHLTMEHFLEDWYAFLEMNPQYKTSSSSSPSSSNTDITETKSLKSNISDSMTYDVAVHFLREMQ